MAIPALNLHCEKAYIRHEKVIQSLKTRNALYAPYYQFAVVAVHRSYWKVNIINVLAS